MRRTALQECKLRLGEDVLFITAANVLYSVIGVKWDLLFSGDVALAYGGAVHFSHLHVALNLSELQSQVLAADGHERAALPGTPQRSDLLGLKSRLVILETLFVCLNKH